jgi:hypothetical protein
MSSTDSETSSSPSVHSGNVRKQLSELIDHLKADIERVDEPRFQALLETSAEVLKGVRTSFEHYEEHREKAWQVSR